MDKQTERHVRNQHVLDLLKTDHEVKLIGGKYHVSIFGANGRVNSKHINFKTAVNNALELAGAKQ
jgi:hypothetical protein